MKEFVGKVITMSTISGDLIGELESVARDGTLKIKNPRLYLIQSNSGPQLMPTINGSAEEFPALSYIHPASFITAVEANKSVIKAWMLSVPENKMDAIDPSAKALPVEVESENPEEKKRTPRILKSKQKKVIDIDV